MRRRWRDFWRKYIKPISYQDAVINKRNLSIAYAFFAWNAAAFLMLSVMRSSFPMTEDEKKKPVEYYRRLYQAEDAIVVHFDGLKVTEKIQHKGVPPITPPEFAVEDPEVLKQ